MEKKYSGFGCDNTQKYTSSFQLTGADRTKLKEEIKIIHATRKANGGLGGYYTLKKDDKIVIDARHIDTNKVMRKTIKDVKKAFKAENIPDKEIWDGDLSEFEIEEPTAVNDTLQWIRDNLFPKAKDDTPAGMGIGTSTLANTDYKPKENKPKSTTWNAVGIAFAVVGATLITWGIVEAVKSMKKKKSAASAAATGNQ